MDYKKYSYNDFGATICDTNGNVLYDPLMDVDEAGLDRVDRLGLAWCRLNRWEWDDYFGSKPVGFDQLPNFDKNDLKRISHPFLMKLLAKLFPRKYGKVFAKEDYIAPLAKMIESEIGEANISRCHWIYGMKRTEEEWKEWYCKHHLGNER